MEHRIILGGEAYLPFARSRIKALKALGFPYANQSFEVDGVSIKVRIEPGHEYIRIEGGAQTLDMDSGLADSYAYAGLQQFLPGTFYETGYAKSYNTPFVASKYPDWRINPNKGAGQVSGRVVGGSGGFKGKVRYDATESRFFKARQVQVPDTDPPQWVDDPEDLELLERKVMTYLVPASMFTGRCRMYVQAMYGRPAFQDDATDAEGRVTQPGAKNIRPSPQGVHGIAVKSYLTPGTVGDRVDVSLNTSTGVYLDPQTGNHWLLQPYEGGITITPLISSVAGEKLRHFLKASQDSLNNEDQEHLEAAILSESLPDVTNSANIALSPVSPLSMGYGWHWNWDGLAADIVQNYGYDQGHPSGEYYGIESTHYRIAVLPDVLPDEKPASGPTRTFKASLVVVEGPTRWAVDRQAWCIACPAIGSFYLTKTTPEKSILFGCEGFFYVFYRRNELIVCRVSVAEHPLQVVNNVSPPSFGGRTTASTIGFGGGESDVSTLSQHFSSVFSIGSLTMPVSTFARGLTAEYTKVHSPKVFIEDQVLFEGVLDTFTMTYSGITVNFPLRPSVNEAGQPINIPYAYRRANLLLSASMSTNHRTESTFTQVAVAVPYFDAEAIYIGGKQIKTTTLTARRETTVSNNNYVTRMQVEGVIYDDLKGDNFGNYGNVIGDEIIPDETTDVTEWSQAWLVSKAGEHGATISDALLLDFHDPNKDIIEDIFNTHSGTRIDSPVVLSRNKSPSIGTGGHDDIDFPVLCGWV